MSKTDSNKDSFKNISLGEIVPKKNYFSNRLLNSSIGIE